ncbi:MAG: radical SAM protein [Candidatus Gracilibacteria bacterium]|nr:radical SAM protein [Candidatus Gracilibacteria bacterium]
MLNIFIGAGSGSEHKICSYHSTIIYNFFKKNGYNLVKSPDLADFIILNGYPFEENEEKKDLLTIGFYLKKNLNAKIILIGSMSGMMKYMDGFDRVILIGAKSLNKFDDLFEHNFSINTIDVDNVKFFIPLYFDSLNLDLYGYSGMNIESKYVFSKYDLEITGDIIKSGNYIINENIEYDYEKYNYLDDISGEYPIEICTGCGGYCTYCDIRNVAGFVNSVPLEKVIAKINRGISLGYKKIHFIDEDSASYGLDIGIDFADLLNEVAKINGDFKLRIFYFEPGRLEKLYEKIDKNVWNKVDHFCVPLQTNSQRILKLMNRRYDINNVIEIVKKIKEKNKNITITTQFIYGFPTETFDEFKSYFSVMNIFDEIWFWYYSDRKGTKSVDFIGKIDKKEMMRRLVYLWKIKVKFLDRIFDKNETLSQGIKIFNNRDF